MLTTILFTGGSSFSGYHHDNNYNKCKVKVPMNQLDIPLTLCKCYSGLTNMIMSLVGNWVENLWKSLTWLHWNQVKAFSQNTSQIQR